ncbi:flagellar biosynthesis protein FlhB [Allopusillimonas ginsengisoli]|uniref:flagellar biosynthesis protein FlhB n=1 Tax=Allopusillimonas ginsengisoli TaxID=453575 RepID=UPI0010227C78|nr:flagellar biosynthesis protein FlhB [Allopusillimonas ginsengisoli]TEA79421.1 flagellar type III secretion system protein FlhB [Allopusillimonas ginsengisoli]
MAEDSDLEKTEPASPQRLQKAREAGQVARSRELSTFFLLSIGLAGLWLGGERMYRCLSRIMHAGLWFVPEAARDESLMRFQAEKSALDAYWSLAPFLFALTLTALLAPAALGGIVLSMRALQPKFERLNPMKGIRRMFSAQMLIELIKTLAKVFLIGMMSVWVISHYLTQMLGLTYVPQARAMAMGTGLVALCCALIVATLILVALIDVPWQLFSHQKKLRMSLKDVRQENKENDGDPQVKARIRQQQRAMARRRMMADVPRADVIVTNPTHYAVALAYREEDGGAPRVVAKGVGLVAARVRQLGEQHRIPILSAPPLARALYHNVDIGQEIPTALYSAAAEVLAWAFQLRNWQRGKGYKPRLPESLPVPTTLDPAQPGSPASRATNVSYQGDGA